jgi:hypothetical protein
MTTNGRYAARVLYEKPRFTEKNCTLSLSFLNLTASKTRRSGRVVECNGLENRQTRKGLVSSNLTFSANFDIASFRQTPAVVL